MARAFTVTAKNGLLRELRTQVHICAAFDPASTPRASHPKLHSFVAIWDTGATGCVITEDVVKACGLKPTGMVKVHGVAGESYAETFVVNFMLPNGVGFANVVVTAGKLGHGVQSLIGMDIISQGDFAITNYQGKTVFTFRCPSCEVVDYVKTPPPKAQPLIAARTLGRNDPCHCGSGKKFKKCHGAGSSS